MLQHATHLGDALRQGVPLWPCLRDGRPVSSMLDGTSRGGAASQSPVAVRRSRQDTVFPQIVEKE